MMNRFLKKLRNQPPERVEWGRFPSVCVKARTNARLSSRRTSSSTNHQTKIATKINFHLSSSRRLIMLQKSSSAHRVRAYYQSPLPVQMECHRVVQRFTRQIIFERWGPEKIPRPNATERRCPLSISYWAGIHS